MRFDVFKEVYYKSISLVKEHKLQFVFSLALQIMLFACLVSIMFGLTIDLTGDLEKISSPLVDVDVSSLSSGGTDSLFKQIGLMYAGYISLMKHIALYTCLILLSFLLFEGWNWVLAQFRVSRKWTKKDWKTAVIYWRRFCERSLLFLLPFIGLFVLFVIQFVEYGDVMFMKGIWLMIVLFALVLFHLLIYVNILSVSGWKKSFKLLLNIIYDRNLKYFLAFILFFVAVLALCGYLLYHFVLVNEVFFMMHLVLVFLLSFVCFSRWYFSRLIWRFLK